MLKFLTSDHVHLTYEIQGEGQPVLFLAGYGAAAETYFSQREALIRAGCRVILLDRRSHGWSDQPAYGHRLSRHAADLQEFMTCLDLKNVILVGQSMGASTIYAYLSLFGDRNISGAVSIDQTPQMLNTETWGYGMYGLTKETMATYFDTPIPSPFARMPGETILSTLNDITSRAPAFDLEGTKPLLLDHAYASWLDVLPQVSVPFLFLAGANSPFWPCEHAKAAAALCPAGEYAIIEDSGHAVNWEQPEKCNEALLQFARKLSEGTVLH